MSAPLVLDPDALAEPTPVPVTVTPSKADALKCERHFALRYFSHTPQLSSEGSQASLDFHRYRRAYAAHLSATGQSSDPPWVLQWVTANPVCGPAIDLIGVDVERFTLDPETVLATDLHLGVDATFAPVWRAEMQAPPSEIRRTLLVETVIDSMTVQGDTATIVDPKTGWHKDPSDAEATIAAVLVFAHYPYINFVEFVPEYIRARAYETPLAYHRELLFVMQEDIRRLALRMADVRDRYRDGQPLSIDIGAGLCGRCPYTCPARAAVTAGILEMVPLQSDEEAQEFALKVYAATIYAARGRELIKQYIKENGWIKLPHGLVAEMRAIDKVEYPLDRVLELLGIPPMVNGHPREKSATWDIPLSSLTVSGSGLREKARAKKRNGMLDQLETIGRRRAAFKLFIGRPADSDTSDEEA